MAIFPGKTIRLKALGVVDLSGTPITSPSSITLVIVDNYGVQQLSTTGITNDGAGNYHYDYTIPNLALNGTVTWKYRYTITNGSYVDVAESSFTIFPL